MVAKQKAELDEIIKEVGKNSPGHYDAEDAGGYRYRFPGLRSPV